MQNSVLFGSHYFLSMFPIVVYALIYAFIYSLLWIGRWRFEGRGYDVAFSSKFGDVFLAIFIIIAALIIREPDFHPAGWMESKTFHFIVIGISIVTAIVYSSVTKPKQVMDKWHALFVVPVFLYLIITTIPVYLQCVDDDGSNLLGFMPLLGWLLLVIYDVIENRMDQRTWIAKNHPEWKFRK